MDGGYHHLHIRQRLSKKATEPFPARTPFLRALDKVMFAAAFLAPLALLPQTVRIYTEHNAGGLSLATWIALTVYNGLWTLYGSVHREKAILIANSLVMLLDLVVVAGILQYQ